AVAKAEFKKAGGVTLEALCAAIQRGHLDIARVWYGNVSSEGFSRLYQEDPPVSLGEFLLGTAAEFGQLGVLEMLVQLGVTPTPFTLKTAAAGGYRDA